MDDNLAKDFKEAIQKADKILIGIGFEFQRETREEVLSAYHKIGKVIQGKDYFILTLCTDDIIYEADFDSDRIVAPCGSEHRYQCIQNCYSSLFSEEEYKSGSLCPNCGSELVQNTVETEKYNESGYLPQWKVYTEWLQKTMNKNIVLIELGCTMHYPGIIRFPFEKIGLYQNKASLFRINESISQIPADIAGKAYEIHENAVTYVRNTFV